MLAQYFGFTEDPFGVTPDARFLYESATHSEALASLKYAFLSARGFTALVAAPGMGKTTLLMRFLDEIRQSARSVFLFDVDPNCATTDVVAYILRDLGIVPAPNSAEMHEQLRAEVAFEANAGRQFVVVIDEAQNLSDSSLEVMRTLTNFETSRSKLIQVVLAGQPQLADKLRRPALEQLRQRITTFCGIQPLSTEQRIAYIAHRLKFAGYNGPPLFSAQALDRIAAASQGVPRVLNNLCWNALSLCCALRRKQVDDAMVSEVLADLQFVTTPVPAPVAAPVALTAPRPVRAPVPVPVSVPAPAPAPIVAIAPAVPTPVPAPPVARPWLGHTLGGIQRHAVATSVAVLLVAGMLALVGFAFHRDPVVPQQVVAPPSKPQPVIAAVRPPVIPEVRPANSDEIAVVVRHNESIRDLSLQYLGDFNKRRVREIMKLNPQLNDPNVILEGQTIYLPRLSSPRRLSATSH
jgi:general secretion pathway protein A